VVVLDANHPQTTAADMIKLYGSEAPLAPVMVRGCFTIVGAVPTQVTVQITFSYTD
jgi:hypothetical protein